MKSAVLVFAFAMLAGHGAIAQTRPSICFVPKAEVAKHPNCVRYYFTCELTYPASSPKPPYDQLTPDQRWTLLVKATFSLAEKTCEQFDYQQALAAMQAKLISGTIKGGL